jgi:hypothetical protein
MLKSKLERSNYQLSEFTLAKVEDMCATICDVKTIMEDIREDNRKTLIPEDNRNYTNSADTDRAFSLLGEFSPVLKDLLRRIMQIII